MDKIYFFPFGQELKKVTQQDRTPKDVFVLGVYASAVHAKWIDLDGKVKVQALAVASEPEIFWRGDNADDIISRIYIPSELGKLLPADGRFNGPSGIALDKSFLKPLGYDRTSAWLCDLLPESRVNENQCKAISEHYTHDIIAKYGLQPATVPHFDKSELNAKNRPDEILKELEQSKAQTLLLLGDLPIYYFLKKVTNLPFSKLSDFSKPPLIYGQVHEIKIKDRLYQVIPLCHPRQADGLGSYSAKWGKLHESWVGQKTSDL